MLKVKIIVLIVFCLTAMSCGVSKYDTCGHSVKKRAIGSQSTYYKQNFKSNKVIRKKYKQGSAIILKRERNEWKYSRNTSVTHRKELYSSGGYND